MYICFSLVKFEGVTKAVSGETTVTGDTSGSKIVVNPTNGRIQFNPDSTWYKGLAEGEVRTKTIDYTVKDPDGVASSSTLTLTVQGINAAPVIADSINGVSINSAFTGTEDGGAITGNLAGYASDPDTGSSLTYSVAAGGDPENGSLVVNANGTFSYPVSYTHLTLPTNREV